MSFTNARDKLLKDPELTNQYPIMPLSLKNSIDYASFFTVLQGRPEFIHAIAPVARRLSGSVAVTSPSNP
jgi:hypothetical protein